MIFDIPLCQICVLTLTKGELLISFTLPNELRNVTGSSTCHGTSEGVTSDSQPEVLSAEQSSNISGMSNVDFLKFLAL
jgi:hypothetical protein